MKQPFNVETFLATVNGGRSISKYRKNQTVFLQGDLADSAFTQGCNKSPVTGTKRPNGQSGKFCFCNIACHSLLRQGGSASVAGCNPVYRRLLRDATDGERLARNLTWPPLRGACCYDRPTPEPLFACFSSGKTAGQPGPAAAWRLRPSLFSLQFGCDVEALRRALMRDSQGLASSPVGALLDLLASRRGS